MSRVYLSVRTEMEAEDCSPECLRDLELMEARLKEHLEAWWHACFAELQKQYPALKITVGSDDEGEEWKS